jgi:predicted amidohydrolase YtcJ
VDPARPEAEAVALRGERILAVGTAAEIRAIADPDRTRIVERPGGLVLPGFIDNHVHFARAGRLLLGANLLDVNAPEAFRDRVADAATRLPEGAWLVGGDWGAYARWERSSTGAEGGGAAPVEPDRQLIDGVTGSHPALISRFDGDAHLANGLALRAAGIDRDTKDPERGEIVRAPGGEPTGLLRGSAAELVRRVIPEPSLEQRRSEALAALERARSRGVTGFHDNVASFDELELLRELRRRGELTARVWARMRLSEWERVAGYAESEELPRVPGGWGDDWIRLGGLKAWVDGIMGNSSALFFEPYAHRPDESGSLRDVMFPEGNLERLIAGADAAGFTVTVHAIGDQANRILLDTYARVFARNPPRERRHRVVHAQVLHPDDLPRFSELGLVAEVQPYHCIDDMRWMEERIGERAAGAARDRPG